MLCSLIQLQRIQGKANFMRRFIPNYAEMTKGFTRFLRKGIPFHWDDLAHKDFDALKYVLVRASLLYPTDYRHGYFTYLVSVVSTISMVLVLLALLCNADVLRSKRSMVCWLCMERARNGHFSLSSFTSLTSKPFPFPD